MSKTKVRLSPSSAESSRDIQIRLNNAEAQIRSLELECAQQLPHKRGPFEKQIADLKAQIPSIKSEFRATASRELEAVRQEVLPAIAVAEAKEAAAKAEVERAQTVLEEALTAVNNARHEIAALQDRLRQAGHVATRYDA